MMDLRERLERVFEQRVLPTVQDARMERMSLAELLYYALVESGDDHGLLADGLMLA
ncbi:hypothetical protein GOB94_02660 [Granulicella sp. 5B5]|uniref:hypothetical protein n=1 Tax=Granulicella sp. 5B5 TaxID=1617967 RepID=UPI0015F73369|nr:hypothetical protein [Granulicella sp. 5B5]QMV17721.1 hypothetical protein GOB94_02660 [Granulicella sp. 5B5]